MAETPAKKEHSLAYKIFHYYFECKLPAYVVNSAQRALMGTPIYEKPDMATQAAMEMVSRQHTVAELVEYHAKGATIILTNPTDALTMYTWLNEYLVELREKVKYSLNTGQIPREDIQKMDAFAGMVYRIARPYEKGVDHRGNKLNRRMDEVFSHRALRKRHRDVEEPVDPNKEPEEIKVREHRPITSDIDKTIIDRQLDWK